MEYAEDGGKVMIGLMNGAAAETAAEVKPMILEALPDCEIVVEKQITATMAIHTGPGLIGIGIFKL